MCKQKFHTIIGAIHFMITIESFQKNVILRSLCGEEGLEPFKFCLGAVGAKKLILIACIKADITRCDECGNFGF